MLKTLLLEILLKYPLYSSIYESYDSATSTSYKFYGPFVNIPLVLLVVANDPEWEAWYFEEAEDIENNYDGFMEVIKTMDPAFTEENLYELVGLKKISYEEHIALMIREEKGKDYIN